MPLDLLQCPQCKALADLPNQRSMRPEPACFQCPACLSASERDLWHRVRPVGEAHRLAGLVHAWNDLLGAGHVPAMRDAIVLF